MHDASTPGSEENRLKPTRIHNNLPKKLPVSDRPNSEGGRHSIVPIRRAPRAQRFLRVDSQRNTKTRHKAAQQLTGIVRWSQGERGIHPLVQLLLVRRVAVRVELVNREARPHEAERRKAAHI